VFSNNLLSFVQIENSQFEENKAFIGGSLLVYNVKLNVSKSNFQNNTALIIGATTFIGGETMRLSKFTKNSYLNNTAYYEGDIRSEAEDIKVSFVSDVSTGINATKPKDLNVSLALQNVSSPALRKGEFIVSFIDKEGRGTPDFSLMKHIVSELPQNKEDKLKFSFDAESVSFSELSGNYTLGNIVIFDRAKAVVPLQIKYSSERFSAEKQVLLSFRECYIGEENNTQTFACESCKAGTYSFEAGKHCLKCPEKAKCPGKTEIIPNPGYWNTERNPSDIITCRDDGTLRCTNLGGEKNCATGYKGPLCEACDFDNSYVETGYLKCGICKDPKTSLIISILFGIVYFGYQIFSIKTIYSANRQIQSEQSDAKTQRKFERSFYLESFLTYTQLISSIYSSTTNNIHQTLGLTAKIGDPSALITYGTQCSMLVFGIEKSDLIFFRMYFIVFQPIFQIIVILLFLSLVKLCKKTLSMNRIIPIVILYFIISYQPGLVSNLATFQSCKTLKGLGYDYIAAHPSWDCNSEQYLRISSHLASPVLIIWCIIIPLLILFGLLGYRKYSAEKLNNVFGMLVYNVKSEYYYWGLVLMALKLLLTFISLVLKDQISLQIFASLLVIWCYQFLVRKWKPYVNKLFNNLEVIIMNLVMFNMIATKYFITPENSALLSYTFLVLCIVLNGGFVLFSAWRIFTLTAKDVLHYHEKAKSWLQKRKEKKKSELEEKLELAT